MPLSQVSWQAYSSPPVPTLPEEPGLGDLSLSEASEAED